MQTDYDSLATALAFVGRASLRLGLHRERIERGKAGHMGLAMGSIR